MIQVDVRSRVPIYEQIINSIKQMSISGVLLPDEKLPSVRELAKDMTINPNTIQKAYQELERQGIIYIKRGQGTFINPDIKAKNKEEKMANLKEIISNIVVESIYLGISKEELIEIIKNIYEKNQVQ
ncbi:GntR family transcriptional regulator [Peptoanaerobacter stomatis]|uniref:GntR family transcriptional regulator n=1 Tax=Peptoanaerobacter stomatis TaxID=796937 RepID=UPI003FA021C3